MGNPRSSAGQPTANAWPNHDQPMAMQLQFAGHSTAIQRPINGNAWSRNGQPIANEWPTDR
eukprot:7693959-Lingulodinium_polyedra.AAC.1